MLVGLLGLTCLLSLRLLLLFLYCCCMKKFQFFAFLYFVCLFVVFTTLLCALFFICHKAMLRGFTEGESEKERENGRSETKLEAAIVFSMLGGEGFNSERTK